MKNGINSRSKSLKSYAQRFDPGHLARTTPLNLRVDGGVTNYPLYALCAFPALR